MSVAAAPSEPLTAEGQADVAATSGARPKQIPEASRKLGSRQQALLAFPGLQTGEGLSSAEAAKALGIAVPNAHAALTTLVDRGLVEQVPDQRPVRWRLIERAPGKRATHRVAKSRAG